MELFKVVVLALILVVVLYKTWRRQYLRWLKPVEARTEEDRKYFRRLLLTYLIVLAFSLLLFIIWKILTRNII